MVKTRIVVALFMGCLLISCGKKEKEPVKTAEEQKVEMDKAAKTTRDNAVWGEQVKSMDKAKAVAEKAAQTPTEDKLLKEGY